MLLIKQKLSGLGLPTVLKEQETLATVKQHPPVLLHEG
jgi:hypothetical protein